ncbi:TetR/AcrR family transcriptional regulator [Acidaminobacter sp. JC074]|uniref:TetR/AcrR family transcriptional regulator n=1 Tax=Acidaminobacter sp. JC074 TaxID=2530199 RepID=UPI001F10B0AB|nr:TetR/AcrR family transcriptional regulator [Acidaminobacter sp. JC074]MCH4887778.1 TetR/AcrR family transcriptional regulator [Acidaminobacter sp. JC074]
METKLKIKEIALDLFAVNGYEGTSIGHITDGVGIKKSSFYSHFKSKETLYLQLLTEVLEWDKLYFEELLDASSNLSVKKKFELIITEYSNVYMDTDKRRKVKFSTRSMMFPPKVFMEENKVIFREKEMSYTPLIANLLREGIQKGEIRDKPISEMIIFFYCVVDGLFVESCYYDNEDFKKRSLVVSDMFWSSIERR